MKCSPAVAMAGSSPFDARRDLAQRRISSANASRSAAVGQVALVEQVPDVLQRALLGQLHGVVLAVVVEALLAPDVAHRGLGHDHALEARRASMAPGCSTGRIWRQLEHVPHRHDADELAVLDDREVAVAVLGQAVEGLVDVHVGADRSGSGVIHSDTLAVPRSTPAAADPHQVALGEDADRPARRRRRPPSRRPARSSGPRPRPPCRTATR